MDGISAVMERRHLPDTNVLICRIVALWWKNNDMEILVLTPSQDRSIGTMDKAEMAVTGIAQRLAYGDVNIW